MDFGFTAVAGITVICYLVAQILRATSLDNKWLPGVCGLLGALLGAAGMYLMPDFPAQDILTAVAVGIVSGLAATGANQVVKQLRGRAGNSM